jgi:hypothetical protein
MPLHGATDRKGRQRNAVIIELHSANLRCAKNDRQKNTANECGLSPCINGFPRPTSMLRGAVIVVRVVVLVKCIFEVDALAIMAS